MFEGPNFDISMSRLSMFQATYAICLSRFSMFERSRSIEILNVPAYRPSWCFNVETEVHGCSKNFPIMHWYASITLPTSNLDAIRAEVQKYVHGICNIQITSTEFTFLIEEERKIPATIVNAYGAVLQQLEEQNTGHSNFSIFSLWLGPLVSGLVNEGRAYETIQGHVEAAVRCKC